MNNRRSFASRFYRFTTRRRVRYVAVAALVAGWSLAIVAANSPAAGADDTSVHLAFTGTILGGFLGFMGMFAGISKWVAEPAARKIMAEHIDRGAEAHTHLVSRDEWECKHSELAEKVSLDRGDLKVLIAEIAAIRKSGVGPS